MTDDPAPDKSGRLPRMREKRVREKRMREKRWLEMKGNRRTGRARKKGEKVRGHETDAPSVVLGVFQLVSPSLSPGVAFVSHAY